MFSSDSVSHYTVNDRAGHGMKSSYRNFFIFSLTPCRRAVIMGSK
uniref:Uncharacterized protein n=1 Tax=Faecalibaculum rodentium TaxID=1702221 RepID=A0A140DWH9_9FIRM|nr:hypothetical protein AALO17_18720 [Faecalibaculum rodentium]